VTRQQIISNGRLNVRVQGVSARNQDAGPRPSALLLPSKRPPVTPTNSNAADPAGRSPTSELVVWPARLIQASAPVIILFEIASALGESTHQSAFAWHLPIRLTCLLLGGVLFMVSFHPGLGERWQLLASIITSAVVAFTTILGIAGETADQFFVDLLVLSLGVTSLLPWSFGWQAAANGLMMIGLATFAAFSPTHDPLLYTHWVGLVAGAAIRQLCAIYGGRYRREIAHDIDELKRSETELIAAREAALSASRAKSEFLSSMSHEIRTPMNAVLGMADVLAETDLNGEQSRYLSTIINNGNLLLELINGILDLAKVESGRVSLERVPFSPREVVERVLETLAIRAHEKRLELIAQIDSRVPELVIGDPFRLRQILTNLVGNAVKFTEHGHVLITLQPDPGAAALLRFVVEDTGIGIPADKLDSLFEPFSQADSSTSRRYGGTGLGLAIVARLVALMGGEIAVESKPDTGSVFRFSVGFATSANSPTLQDSLPDFSNRKILVVDDNSANCEAVRLLLAERGAMVSIATSGASAIESIRGMRRQSKLFDAIVIDSFMPDLDGYHIVQQTGHGPARLVIMLPSANPKVDTQRLAPLGVGGYVVKPVKRHELLAAVAAVVGQCAAAAPVSVEYQNRKHTAAPPGEPMRILFADDSPDNRALIKAYMKSTPHLIDFAEDGKEAINKFMTNHYDLVFMDIQMPIVDGYTAVQEIRRWENYMSRSPTPVVALTASADMEAVRRTKEAGCNLHVSKPLKKATLLATIKSCTHEPAATALSSPPSQVA
jgi:signal transduction histidine kinase/DNA-binding response OmpR family regulator